MATFSGKSGLIICEKIFYHIEQLVKKEPLGFWLSYSKSI